MKTVQDYLDLWLVFVSGDKICGVTGDLSSNELDIFDGKLCEKKSSKGAVRIGVDCYARARWTPSSFAWRNNDGVKPEYKGLIDICFEDGVVSHNESAIDFEWSLDDENYIVKWRPVVLQSESPTASTKEDKPMKPSEADQSCREPKAIFNTESTMFGDRLRLKAEDFEKGDFNMSIITGKPMKQFKTSQEANAIVAAHIGSMKPVYTAEMHAKGELPQVGSEVALRYKFDSKQIHIIGKVLYASMEHCIIDGEHKECHYKMCDYTYEPIIKTIKVNGFDVPAPMSEAPEDCAEYFIPSLRNNEFVDCHNWHGDSYDELWLSRCQCHQTESAAIAHAKAMLGIDPTKDAK